MDDRDEAETVSRTGFPEFEHGQWTIEGEIERFGAFARGARRAGGAKRIVATILVIGLIVPMVAGTVSLFIRAIVGDDDPQLPRGVTVVELPDRR